MRGFGYLISIVSVLFLGMAAWPGPAEPQWKFIVVTAGMTTSIIGMLLRWAASRKQMRELQRVERGVGVR